MLPRSLRIVAASLLLLLVSAGGEASAQIFKYVDENGLIRFTDSYDRIPPKYRNQVEERNSSARASSAQSSSSPIPSRRGSAGPAEPDWLERLAANAFIYLNEQEGESMTAVERRAVEGWAADWAWAALWASTISSLIVMGMVVHAFMTDHKLWGIANFVIGFTAIPYLFMYVEKPLAVRLGMFLGVCSPIPVFFALFSRLVATI